MTDDLGGQTITVIGKVSIGRGDYADGAHVAYDGCSVQPMSPQEQARYGLTVTRRWKLYGPASVRADARAEVEVDDILDDQGVPLRLGLFGPVVIWPDEHGTPDHAEAILQIVEGA